MKTAICSLGLLVLLAPLSAVYAQKSAAEQQADALIDRALRQNNPQSQQDLADQAEKLYQQAVAEAKANVKKAPDEKAARLKVGILLLSQAKVYIDLNKDKVLTERAKIVGEARTIMEALEKEQLKEKAKDAQFLFLTKAWLFKCCEEGGDPDGAKKYRGQVLISKNKDAEEAQALLRYFTLGGGANKKQTPLDRARNTQKDAEAWLKDYPLLGKTPLAYAVRFELATSMFAEADYFNQKKKQLDKNLAEFDMEIKEAKDQKSTKSVEAILGKEKYLKYQAEKKDLATLAKDNKLQTARMAKVQEICKALIETENDFTEKAKGLDLFISRLNVADKSSSDLSTFELCYMRAQEEMERMGKLNGQIKEAKSPDEKATLEKNRKTMFQSIARTINRGLSLADAKTAANELDDARYDLLVSYMALQDPYRTAVAGESMSRIKPLSKKGALAAGYAIQAYADIVGTDNSEANRNRLRDMANYVLGPECQQAWAKDPVSGVARFQLAMLYLSEGNLAAGIEQLQKVPPEFPAFIYAQAKLVFVALDAKERAKTPEEKKHFQDVARKVLGSLPPLPASADPSSATLYFHARMEETKFLYADAAEASRKGETVLARKLYQQMAGLVAQLSKELQAAPQIGAERQGQLSYYMETMRKYSVLGLADFEYRGGAYDKVLELTAPVVDLVRKEAAKSPVIRMKDFQVTGEVLGLALRAYVQKGQIDDAKQLLKILENLKGVEDNLLVDSSGVLRNLVVELEIQIRDLQRAGDRDKLKKTVANFSDFLDALIKQSEKKALEKNDIFFLAKCYDSLDQHEKASKLYAMYPVPKFINVVKKGDKDKFSEEDEKELQTYWYTQVQQARQLRMANKLKEAKKILDALQEHKNARQQLMAEREQNHLLEDNGLYGTAITHWSQFMNNPGLKKNLASDSKIKEIYFDAYYHLTYCWFKYSQSDKVKKAGKDTQFLDKAVDFIIRLETAMNKEGWQIVEYKFRELLRAEPTLNDAYRKKKAATPA